MYYEDVWQADQAALKEKGIMTKVAPGASAASRTPAARDSGRGRASSSAAMEVSEDVLHGARRESGDDEVAGITGNAAQDDALFADDDEDNTLLS